MSVTSPVTFWASKIYKCANCLASAVFLLENGVDGPVGSVRTIKPSPSIAGPCPACNAAESLTHPGWLKPSAAQPVAFTGTIKGPTITYNATLPFGVPSYSEEYQGHRTAMGLASAWGAAHP